MSFVKTSVSAQTAAANNLATLVRPLADRVVLSTDNRKAMLAMESATREQATSLESSYASLHAALKDVLGADVARYSKVALEAAATAGMYASNWEAFAAQDLTAAPSSPNSVLISAPSRDNIVSGRVRPGFRSAEFAMEAYSERENRAATAFNIQYQLGAATQDAMGEMLYPTIVMDPTRDAYEVVADLIMVFNGADHSITGAVTDFQKHNLIRAIANPNILEKNQTRATPVYRTENAANLLTPGDAPGVGILAKTTLVNNGEGEFATAPIKTGKKVNLIGLCQSAAVVAQGGYNFTDTLDSCVDLEAIYLQVTNGADTSIIKLKTKNLPYSNFVASPQDNYRKQNLNMQTSSLVINKNTKDVFGADAAALAAVITNHWLVRVEANITGYVNIETGELYVSGQITGVPVFQTSEGVNLSQSAVGPAAIVAALSSATIIGYDVRAYLTNENRRRQGQKTDMTRLSQQYRVPMRAPITAMHPAHVDSSIDASDVQQLVQHTRTRVQNEVVTSLFEQSALLADFNDIRDTVDIGPDTLGIGRLYVRPVHISASINMLTLVDSLTSKERTEDLREALMIKVRDWVYTMYTQSEYQAANSALNGGMDVKPTVFIATDPYIAQYLMVAGDSRTLGPEFEYKVVSTLDRRMKGKMFIGFTVFNDSRNTVPNPLSFGNLLWATELALTANITRGQSTSRETMVQPRYLFVHHCPILAEIDVAGITSVLSKVSVNMHTV